MQGKTKTILIWCIFAMMFLPFIQSRLNFISERPRYGVNAEVREPAFSLTNWFNGTWQDSMQIWLSANAGFKNSMMRLKNQIQYSLFSKAGANGVIIGKDNCLFDKSNIHSWTGQDFIGDSVWAATIQTLGEVQKGFAKKNKKLIFVTVAGKGYYFPELIPGNPPAGAKTNYKSLIAYADSFGINFVDFNFWSRILKRKNQPPMYNMNGMHLDQYGQTLVLDSLLTYLEKLTGRNLAGINIDSVYWQNKDVKEENDLARGLNLFIDPLPEKLPYADFTREDKPRQLRTLIVGDSYASGIFYSDPWQRAFEQSELLFYFRELQGGGRKTPEPVENIDLKALLDAQDVVILLISDGNLGQRGWGFIEKAAALYSEKEVRKSEIARHRYNISNSPEWMKVIEQKAKEKGISADSMLTLDAIYLYDLNISSEKKP